MEGNEIVGGRERASERGDVRQALGSGFLKLVQQSRGSSRCGQAVGPRSGHVCNFTQKEAQALLELQC